MWNRLKPEDQVTDILKIAGKRLPAPKFTPCDLKAILDLVSTGKKRGAIDKVTADVGLRDLVQTLR